jgi:hypothetical protein
MENVFGIMVARFGIFKTHINIKLDNINPLAFTAGCKTAGLARSVNTQPAVRQSEPSMSSLLILAFCQ